MPQFYLLAINPGSTSTKIAVFADDVAEFSETIRHTAAEMAPFHRVIEQLPFRQTLVAAVLKQRGLDTARLSAVVGRGGPLKPLQSGTYVVNDKLVHDLYTGTGLQAEHASILGGLLARGIAETAGVPAFIVDPVSVDEFIPLARVTGLPELSRRSLFHALNMKAVAHQVAKDLARPYASLTLIIAHLGGGISVGVQQRGQMIDVANPNESGPFSPERAGALPTGDLVRLCFDGAHSRAEIERRLVGQGGLVAHLGTNDAREVEKRIDAGDEHAALIFEAMAYQIAKEIGAMAAVVNGEIDAVVLTGGLAHSARLVAWIRRRVSFLGPVMVYPGEDEMQALAAGALRVLRGEEAAREYM